MDKTKTILVAIVFLILSGILFFIGWKIYEFKKNNNVNTVNTTNIKNTTPIQKSTQSPEEAQILECNKISDESERELCYLEVGLDSSNTSGYFNNIGSCANYMEGLTKSLCYSGFAVKQNDLALCNNLKTEKYITTCQNAFYMKQGSANQCENITNKNEAMRCVYELAEKNQDYTICETMDADFWPKDNNYVEKYQCYIKVAKKKKDKTICDKIPDNDSKNWCYDMVN